MTDTTSLPVGEKIKYFRKRAGFSQFELESAINASSGSISRIESGKTNPTKETLFVLADKLKLQPKEQAYLFELLHDEPTKEELEQAILEVASVLNSPNHFAYLLDHYSRIVRVSEGFNRLGKSLQIDANNLLGANIPEITFDPKYGIRNLIPSDKFDEVGIPVLAVLNQERKYMLDHGFWNDVVKRLKKLPDFKRLWKVIQTRDIDIMLPENRTLTLSAAGQTHTFQYAPMPLNMDPRFMLVEYYLKS